jgi:glycosyltransferase involved in cell wall biosynthesis
LKITITETWEAWETRKGYKAWELEGDRVKKSIIVRGPILSQSGYGEHARLVLRSLRQREDELDIFVVPTGWGETGWLCDLNDERAWMDDRIMATNKRLESKVPFDVSVQVTIPNEWEKMAPINIGVTAGIESNKVSPVWLEKSNYMDKVVTISEHSKAGFTNTSFEGFNKETGEKMRLKMETDIEVVGYPVKSFSSDNEIGLDLDFDFNYLTVSQWGPRKNLDNLIRWFIEENHRSRSWLDF